MKIGEYETHRYADAFRMLEGARWGDFLEDIKVNGLRDKKITTYQGKVLDGRNRLSAAILLKLQGELEFVELHGDDVAAFMFVISANLHRRHDDLSQRAMSACRLADLRPGRRGKRKNAPTLAEASKVLGVSERSADHASAVLQHGVPELVAAVDSGELAVSRAAEIAKLEPEAQLVVLAAAAAPASPKRTKRATGELTQVQATEQLKRTLTRALEQLGASVESTNCNRTDHLEMRFAYGGRIYELGVLEQGLVS